jgi:hypothetical protein
MVSELIGRIKKITVSPDKLAIVYIGKGGDILTLDPEAEETGGAVTKVNQADFSGKSMLGVPIDVALLDEDSDVKCKVKVKRIRNGVLANTITLTLDAEHEEIAEKVEKLFELLPDVGDAVRLKFGRTA